MSKLMDTIEFNPKAVIMIDAEDLLEFVNEVYAAAEVAASTKQKEKVKDAQEEETISRVETAKILGVTSTTLWRWDQVGYLKSIHVGAKVFYRKSDVLALKLDKER